MATRSIEESGAEDDSSRFEANRAISTIERRARDGSVAMLVGGALLVWALKTVRSRRGRGILLALTSVALLGFGMRQRRTERGEDRIETEDDVRRDEEGEKRVSDDAHVEREGDLGAHRTADESSSVYQVDTEPNPRGVSDRSDVEADEGGDIDFVEGKEPGTHQATNLDEEGSRDTRLQGGDDEQTEVDLSEAAMADEVSEATGPQPEQAYPTHEGTDPEPTSAEAPERLGEGGDAPGDSDDEEYRGRGDEERRGSDDTEEGQDESGETTDEQDASEVPQEADDHSTEGSSEDDDT